MGTRRTLAQWCSVVRSTECVLCAWLQCRHFIASYYPVLQYHNTELELNIDKVVDGESPAQLSILKGK